MNGFTGNLSDFRPESRQVIMERAESGHYIATVVTRSGVEISREPILTWQDEMRWINTARAMRDEWNSHGLEAWDATHLEAR